MGGGVVSSGGLLVQTVDLKHLLVGGALGKLLNVLSGGVELILEVKSSKVS